MKELSLWLDYYDDIYSDFDSRHYGKRRVSDDFMHELRNSIKYHEENFQDLFLLLPPEKREERNELIIAGSLKDYFNSQYQFYAGLCRKKLQRSMILGILGILLMTLNAFASMKFSHTLIQVFLRVVADPAGWFMLWAAFDLLFYDWKEKKKEKDLYRKLAGMNIHFKSS